MELPISECGGKTNLLRKSIAQLNAKHVRSILDSLGPTDVRRKVLKENPDLIHLLINTQSRASLSTCCYQEKIKILYMLVDSGADTNAELLNVNDSEERNCCITPLWLAMSHGIVPITQVLLQCGADINYSYKNKTLWNWVVELTSDDDERFSWCKNLRELRNLFLKFGKGLRQGVLDVDLESVRMSINFCFRPDITVNNRDLVDIARETGNEDIAKVIIRATPYLTLAHHVLAQDVWAVQNWYEKEPANLSSVPYFCFGSGGNVPLIHFAIQYQNVDLIQLLLAKGHRVTARMSFDHSEDTPVFFSSLHPTMPVEGIQALLENLEKYEEKIHRLFWKDSNVLHIALHNRCSLDVTRLLLEHGGPHLLCQRNASNRNARELADFMQLDDYVDMIDQTVTRWLTSDEANKDSNKRTLLALYSYDLTNIFENKTLIQTNLEDYKCEFYRLQEQLEDLYNAVIENDIDKSRRLLHFESSVIGFHNLSLQCRLAGEGLPLLHIAVLCKFEELVQLMVDDTKTTHQDINSVRDQFGRTALHYAYASTNSTRIIRILIDSGCTEAVFDMNGRRPDDFKEMRGTPEMELYLKCLRLQDYSALLVDPLDPNVVAHRRKLQWEWRVEAYRKNKSSFVGCRGTGLQNGSHFRHPLNDQPIWCNVL